MGTKTASIAAAIATRPKASVSGGISATATLPKKKAPPHSSESKKSCSQSVADIESWPDGEADMTGFREFEQVRFHERGAGPRTTAMRVMISRSPAVGCEVMLQVTPKPCNVY
jgi:hypothetical protein